MRSAAVSAAEDEREISDPYLSRVAKVTLRHLLATKTLA